MLRPLVPFLLALCAAPTSAQRVLATGFGTVTDGRLGTVVRAAGDVDGDGVGDFVISEPTNSVAGTAYLISGATRTTLATFRGSNASGMWGLGQQDISPVGDVDGDGHADFALGYVNRGALDVFSGANGARLYRMGPAIEFLQRACAAGDLDGDGRDDFVAFAYVSSDTQLWAIRGSDGSMLNVVNPRTTSSGPLVNVGDVTGDGHPEVAICGAYLEVYDLHPPRQLLRAQVPFSSVVDAGVTDWNGDGSLDVLMSSRSGSALDFLVVMSPATGAVLDTISLPPDDRSQPSGHFAVLPDVDGDGHQDLVVGGGPDPLGTSTAGTMLVLSGATGRRISAWPGTSGFWVNDQPVASPGDVDGDGIADYVIGASNAATGRGGWQLISGRPLAGMLVKPVNCYAGPFAPTLGITRPVLGQSMTVAGRDAPGGTVCVVGLSLKPVDPTSLGVAGCDAWLDPAGWLELANPAGAPSWQFAVPLPDVATLTGLEVALQAIYVGTNSAIGADLTNGIWARLGY